MIPTNLPQKANIQGLWHLNETSGTRYDETTNDNNLTDNNTVLYGTGKIGNAADFELATSEYLSITDAAQTGLDITGEITICAWIKLESIDIQHTIAAKYDRNGKRSYCLIVFDTDNKLGGYLSVDGTASTEFKSTGALSAGTWYHVAFTLNQTTDKIQTYIDGIANGAEIAYTTDINDGTAPFAIGCRFNTNPEYYADSLIDEPIVWNKCLTPAEVLQVKNIGYYQYGGGFLSLL